LTHYLLGTLHRSRKDYRLAEEHIHTALELIPDHSGYWCELGMIYQEQDDLQSARRYAQTARNYASYANRAGQYDDLVRFFESDG
jgi:Flp pilus assembly protein TadD